MIRLPDTLPYGGFIFDLDALESSTGRRVERVLLPLRVTQV
jgi:hypothetical protein